MIRYNVHLEDHVLQALRQVQKRTGVPVAWQIREAIAASLRAQPESPPPAKDPRQLELDFS